MHLQNRLGRSPHVAANGLKAKPLTGFVAMAAREAVVLAFNFQDVDGFLQTNFLNRRHQGFHLLLIILAVERTANCLNWDFLNFHSPIDFKTPLYHTHNEYELQAFRLALEIGLWINWLTADSYLKM
jgi:hypothetical protein